tara:strand:- start:86 stop:481 length:396 start_codon:yes stop_codon:yes gene_type:complete
MFNPWLILGIVLMIVGSGVTGYIKGSKHAQDAARAAHATALESAIKDANERATIDARALIDYERERQEVRIKFQDKIVTVERLIRENPSECRISDERFGLLNLAIDDANNRSAVAKHGQLPPATEASKPQN